MLVADYAALTHQIKGVRVRVQVFDSVGYNPHFKLKVCPSV